MQQRSDYEHDDGDDDDVDRVGLLILRNLLTPVLAAVWASGPGYGCLPFLHFHNQVLLHYNLHYRQIQESSTMSDDEHCPAMLSQMMSKRLFDDRLEYNVGIFLLIGIYCDDAAFQCSIESLAILDLYRLF